MTEPIMEPPGASGSWVDTLDFLAVSLSVLHSVYKPPAAPTRAVFFGDN